MTTDNGNAAERDDRSGLEQVQALARGEYPTSPMTKLIPFETELPEKRGHLRFRATPDKTHLNGFGVVHGGWAMTMLDNAMGLAAHSMVEAGEFCPSIETTVKFIGRIDATGEALIADRRVDAGAIADELLGRMPQVAGAVGTALTVLEFGVPPLVWKVRPFTSLGTDEQDGVLDDLMRSRFDLGRQLFGAPEPAAQVNAARARRTHDLHVEGIVGEVQQQAGELVDPEALAAARGIRLGRPVGHVEADEGAVLVGPDLDLLVRYRLAETGVDDLDVIALAGVVAVGLPDVFDVQHFFAGRALLGEADGGIATGCINRFHQILFHALNLSLLTARLTGLGRLGLEAQIDSWFPRRHPAQLQRAGCRLSLSSACQT